MATTLGILSYLVVAAFYDLQFRRVPNMLVIPGMISAFFISILYRGIDGIPDEKPLYFRYTYRKSH